MESSSTRAGVCAPKPLNDTDADVHHNIDMFRYANHRLSFPSLHLSTSINRFYRAVHSVHQILFRRAATVGHCHVRHGAKKPRQRVSVIHAKV